jgi:hypothetical protein
MAEILQNIEIFEFEDRKHLQIFITELYNQYREVIEETLDYNKTETVLELVGKYDQQGMSTFIGNILRLYTKSNKLIGAYQNIELLNKLALLITNPDFSI